LHPWACAIWTALTTVDAAAIGRRLMLCCGERGRRALLTVARTHTHRTHTTYAVGTRAAGSKFCEEYALGVPVGGCGLWLWGVVSGGCVRACIRSRRRSVRGEGGGDRAV
jgi:hypothetical protein